MRKIYEDSYEYADPGGARTACRLTVYKAAGGIVAVARVDREHGTPGPEVMALAYDVWQAHGAPAQFTWIEEDAREDRIGPRYRLLEFVRRPDGQLARPRRRGISRQAVAALLAQDYEQPCPPGWLSLPAQGLQVDCLACGCRLPISAILANLRYCSACQTAPAALADTSPEPPRSEELFRAREEFRRRAAAHEQKLGLTPRQRTDLFRVLGGSRSLWDFRPQELRTLLAQLEQFDSAAEVQEFIDVRSNAELS